jgi:cold shock protein
VHLADGSGDAFLHVSVAERSGHGSVPPGATLELRTSPGPKGPQVTEIIRLDASTASQEPPRRPRPERSAYPSGDRATVEQLGTVKWYDAKKGFGFISPLKLLAIGLISRRLRLWAAHRVHSLSCVSQ